MPGFHIILLIAISLSANGPVVPIPPMALPDSYLSMADCTTDYKSNEFAYHIAKLGKALVAKIHAFKVEIGVGCADFSKQIPPTEQPKGEQL